MLCSKHFKPEHFDRTGQTVRIRLGVVPSIFAFPAHLLKSTASTDRTTSNSRRAKESLPMDIPQYAPVEPAALPQSQLVDHTYALSSCPFALKEGYIKAKDNVSRLQREKTNTRKRELRAKSSLQDVLMELREKNLMTEELSQRVGLYADLPLHLFEKKASEYSKEHYTCMDPRHTATSEARCNFLSLIHAHCKGDEVFVIMDACHMLKLARNMLESYRTINSGSGRIEWKHIVELNNVQKKAGLHAANKLTDTHVSFNNQKMKVFLAAQTLSNSVAVALRTLKDLGYEQFNDCEATVEFLQEAGITTQLLDSSRVSSASSCIDVVSSLWILAM
ncbi:uncharacterized protein LOC132460693 [Gadus macrocephalus]|uniref:uncharacterized protein LOC132460693 n=1 Tax=Gadus macrocephalus TaxID=80720 RepID=UPI0028CBB55D|nr:uncharacterized protein LOC132460693 [Gadus macrocephalus]